jgi:vacuolar iron transporter family protein
MDRDIDKGLLKLQISEITEYHVYSKLAKRCTSKKNKRVLERIAKDELKHYNVWKKHTKVELPPDRFKMFWYMTLARIFGLTFGLALMERNEIQTGKAYKKLSRKHPAIRKIRKEEFGHEQELVRLIQEEKLHYLSSIVLGINDGLVELTGVLAGLTFALQNTKLIGIVGLITGIAASLSMASSEYLSIKTEANKKKNPILAATYTGIAYFITVLILVAPYMLLSQLYLSLAWTVVNAIIIIFFFTYYISVTKKVSFKRRFFEMALISLGIATFSFFIGYVIRTFFGIEI